MIGKCNSTHARNHRKARHAHMKKMVRNEDAFAQRFRTAKGVRTLFFSFCFGAIAAYGLKTDPSSGPIFFCSVNGGLKNSRQYKFAVVSKEQNNPTLLQK